MIPKRPPPPEPEEQIFIQVSAKTHAGLLKSPWPERGSGRVPSPQPGREITISLANPSSADKDWVA